MNSDALRPPANSPTQVDIRLSTGIAVASALLCIVLAHCYYFRYDACAAVTIFPAWGWLLPGMLPLGFGLRAGCYRLVCTVGLLWTGFFICTAGEPVSLCRELFPLRRDPQKVGQTVRVVSINCGEGGRLSVEEAIALSPDIILVQESPGPEQLRGLADNAFGDEASILYGSDTSIVVMGQILEVGRDGPARRYSVRARVRLISGLEVEVISLRLEPCPVRLDLWSPDCWRQQAGNRRTRRNQLQKIMMDLLPENTDVPKIVGGDFNAPAGDAIYRLLGPQLRDAFTEAGRGWGNTIVNDFPVQRIDQIWINQHFQAVSVIARQTEHSDHCLVVCDLLVR